MKEKTVSYTVEYMKNDKKWTMLFDDETNKDGALRAFQETAKKYGNAKLIETIITKEILIEAQ